MKLYFHKTPRLLKRLYSDLIWTIETERKEIYLTFDDGPIPILTPYILDQLGKFNAKATFFCVGDNVRKHPEILEQAIASGHVIGNHTYNHLNGWKTDSGIYLDNIRKCQEYINQYQSLDSKPLFRPPYGRIKREVIRGLKQEYDIVMWDNLTADFDRGLDKKECYRKAIENTSLGSIVVFHDNIKAESNLNYVLPKYLETMTEQGYLFKSIKYPI